MVIRKAAIRARLARLEEVTSRLGDLTALTREAFRADYRHEWLAERGLELGAQAVLDIATTSWLDTLPR